VHWRTLVYTGREIREGGLSQEGKLLLQRPWIMSSIRGSASEREGREKKGKKCQSMWLLQIYYSAPPSKTLIHLEGGGLDVGVLKSSLGK
jgi:hypothetical protein